MSENPDPYDSWALHLYAITTITTSSSLIVAYSFTIYKAWKGTFFRFVIALLTLLILSNIGQIGCSYFSHDSTHILSQMEDGDSFD